MPFMTWTQKQGVKHILIKPGSLSQNSNIKFVVTYSNAPAADALSLLEICLVSAMTGRLAWLAWRLPASPEPAVIAPAFDLPRARVRLWAALSSGLVLALSLVARSLASTAGKGFLTRLNYALKLIELPLVLAVQLVASLVLPAITRTQAGSPARQQAVRLAFFSCWGFGLHSHCHIGDVFASHCQPAV